MRKAILVSVIYIILMSVLYPLMRYYALNYQVETHNTVRFVTGACASLAYVFSRAELRSNFLSIFQSKKLLLTTLGIGCLNVINMLCLIIGLRLTSSVAVSIFGIMAMPLAVCLGAIFFVDERSKVLRWKFVIGSFVAIVGSLIFVFNAQGVSSSDQASENSDFLLGSLLLACAICCQSVFNILVKHLGVTLNSMVMTTMTFSSNAVIFAIISSSTGAVWEIVQHSWYDVLGLMGVGLIGVAAGLMLVLVIKQLGIVMFNVIQLMMPIATATVGYLLLHETVNLYQVLGAGVVIFGCVYAILIKDKTPSGF